VLLTPIGTDKQLHSTSDELGISGVAQIFDPFVDAIEIDVCTLA